MPYTATDHQETRTIEMSNFMGGMNSSVPPTQIADNECTLIENMYMDRVSGKLRSRFPIRKYSASAVSTGINGLWYWKNNWIVASTDRFVYYLDSSKTPVLLGQLNGTSRPCFCPFGDKLVIASGGFLQYVGISGTTPQALANIAACTSKVKYVMYKYGRLVVGGDADYPDRIIESGFEAPDTWSYGATDYADVGYLDDTEICGITEAFEGMYLIFKRGSGGLKTYYVTTLSSTTPNATLAAENHAPVSHAGIMQVLTRVYLMERNHIACLVGTDAQGKIIYDQTPGMKISQSFKTTADGFAVLYPRDAQIWFVPDPNLGQVYVYHYHIGTWTKFSFGSRKIRSAFYDGPSDYLYVGCDDGYVYKYNYDSMLYSDTAGSYTSRFTTKMFAQGNREMVLKSPRLVWTTLAAGSGTLKVITDYGQTSTNWGTVTTSAPQVYVYNTADSAIVDYTTFTEVDTPGRISVAANAITVTACTRRETVYDYYDYTAGYFSGDFSFRFSFNVSASSGNLSIICPWGISNTLDDIYVSAITGKHAACWVEVDKYVSAGIVSLQYIAEGATYGGGHACYYSISHDTTYVVEVDRDYSAGTLTMKVYNSTGATLHFTGSVPCGTEAFRYVYSFSSFRNDHVYTTDAWSGTVSSLYANTGNIPLYVYDTRAGGNDEMYVWPETVYEEQKGDYNQPTESFQFDVALTSGGFMIERLVADVAASRRV
jgi:hypothetical protein